MEEELFSVLCKDCGQNIPLSLLESHSCKIFCPVCRRDIPISEYETHSLECSERRTIVRGEIDREREKEWGALQKEKEREWDMRAKESRKKWEKKVKEKEKEKGKAWEKERGTIGGKIKGWRMGEKKERGNEGKEREEFEERLRKEREEMEKERERWEKQEREDRVKELEREKEKWRKGKEEDDQRREEEMLRALEEQREGWMREKEKEDKEREEREQKEREEREEKEKKEREEKEELLALLKKKEEEIQKEKEEREKIEQKREKEMEERKKEEEQKQREREEKERELLKKKEEEIQKEKEERQKLEQKREKEMEEWKKEEEQKQREREEKERELLKKREEEIQREKEEREKKEREEKEELLALLKKKEEEIQKEKEEREKIEQKREKEMEERKKEEEQKQREREEKERELLKKKEEEIQREKEEREKKEREEKEELLALLKKKEEEIQKEKEEREKIQQKREKEMEERKKEEEQKQREREEKERELLKKREEEIQREKEEREKKEREEKEELLALLKKKEEEIQKEKEEREKIQQKREKEMEERKKEEEQKQREREEKERELESERDKEREEWEKEKERRAKEEEKLRKRLKKAKKKGAKPQEEIPLSTLLAAEYDEEKVIFLQRAIRRWLMRRRWSVMGSYSQSKESLKVRLRNEAIKEVLDSERVYVRRLQFAIKHFMTPLEDSTFTKKALLTQDQISSIFLQIDVIEAVNRTLLTALEERMEQWPAVTEIGDIFRRLAPIMKLYSSYIRNFKKGQDMLVEVKKSNTEFAEWLTKREMDPNCRQDLPSFLILPVQRLPRYQMLIEGVIKHIDKDHSDYNNLVAARESVVSVIHQIQEEGRSKENRERVINIQDDLELEGLFDNEGVARKIMGEGGIEGFVVEEVTQVDEENEHQNVFYPSRVFDFHSVDLSDKLYNNVTSHQFVIQELPNEQEQEMPPGFVAGGCVLHWIDVVSKGGDKGVLKVQRAMSLEHGASICSTSLGIKPTTTWKSFLEQYCKKILHRNVPLPSSPSQFRVGWVSPSLSKFSNFPSSSSLSYILRNCFSWELNNMMIFKDHLLFCWKKGSGSLRNPCLIVPTLFRSVSMNSKKEIHISVLSVGGIFCRFSFSFSMATPVEEKKLMSGLESNYTKEGCAISYGPPLTWEGAEEAAIPMGEKFAKRVGGGEILRLVKNSIPKKEEKEYSTPLSARNGRKKSYDLEARTHRSPGPATSRSPGPATSRSPGRATSRSPQATTSRSPGPLPIGRSPGSTIGRSPKAGKEKKRTEGTKSFDLPPGANPLENEQASSPTPTTPTISPASSPLSSPISHPSSPLSSTGSSPPSSPQTFSLSSSPKIKKKKGSQIKKKRSKGSQLKKKEGKEKKKSKSQIEGKERKEKPKKEKSEKVE